VKQMVMSDRTNLLHNAGSKQWLGSGILYTREFLPLLEVKTKLSGCFVIPTLHVLRLHVEEMASRYGGYK